MRNERLLLIEGCHVLQHRVEGDATESPARSPNVAKLFDRGSAEDTRATEIAIALRLDYPTVPFGVEPANLGRLAQLCNPPAAEHFRGALEMWIPNFARDKEFEDLTRSLADQIEPRIAENLLDWYRLLTPRAERIGLRIAAPAANLHGGVDDLPEAFRREQLGGRRFDPEVRLTAIDHPAD